MATGEIQLLVLQLATVALRRSGAAGEADVGFGGGGQNQKFCLSVQALIKGHQSFNL